MSTEPAGVMRSVSSLLLVMAVLCFAALTFFLWRLGGDPTAFLYRPDSDVSDLTVTFWPNVAYIQRWVWSSGELPLWRTLIFSGSPFDADPQSGLWYPPNLVLLLLPVAVGFNFLFLLHVVTAGLGLWVWSRATGTSTSGAILAAVAYAFTPKILAHLGFGHVGLVYAAAYVPWVLWAAYRVGRGSWRHVGILSLMLGWQFIAHPQLAFYTGLTAGGYGLTIGIARTIRRGAQRSSWNGLSILGSTGRWCVALLLTLAVAAVQLLPMLRLAPLSARSGMGFSESAVSSLPLRYLWGLLLADHRGFMDYVLYVGVPVLALAVASAGPRRRFQVAGWGAFVVIALVYSLGTNTPFYGWAFRLLPALSWLRAPSRIWFVVAAVLALLAGWGFDHLLDGIKGLPFLRLKRVAVGLGALAPALALGYAVAFGKPPVNLAMLGGLVPVTAALCVGVAARRLPRRTATIAFVVLLLADLWVMDATLVAGVPAAEVFADDGLSTYLIQHDDGEGLFRVYSPSYSLPRHVAARAGLEAADGVDPLYLEEYAAFMEVASGVVRLGYGETVPALEGEGPLATLNRDARPNVALLSLLNVRYVAAEFPMRVEGLSEVGRFGSTHLYASANVLPRAFIVEQVDAVDDFDAALDWVQAHDTCDLARKAVVEGGGPLLPRAPQSTCSECCEVNDAVTWLHRSPNHLRLEAELDRPGFLVLSQVWYADWRAEVDGQPARLWKTDAVLSGLYLVPGKHVVSLDYCPVWTWIGGGVSLAALIAVCLVGFGRKRKQCRTINDDKRQRGAV